MKRGEIALPAIVSMIAKVCSRPKALRLSVSARPPAVADSRRAAATAAGRSFASAAWKARESASHFAAMPGAATLAAADSMIMFSSLNGGMPDGIGRPGLATQLARPFGPSMIWRWQLWQSKK